MKPKQLEWTQVEEGCFVANTAIGNFFVFRDSDGRFGAQHYMVYDFDRISCLTFFESGFPTESAAKASCQREFDRIHAAMTDTTP